MKVPLDDSNDAEDTAGGFLFGGERAARELLPEAELRSRLSALMRSCAGCENIVVTATTRLDVPDSEGCNWSSSIVLDPAGVAAETYGLAYASVIAMARASWNLE